MAEKKKEIYKETYKKGVIFNDHESIIVSLKKKNTVVELVNAGKFNDGSEFATFKIIFK